VRASRRKYHETFARVDSEFFSNRTFGMTLRESAQRSCILSVAQKPVEPRRHRRAVIVNTSLATSRCSISRATSRATPPPISASSRSCARRSRVAARRSLPSTACLPGGALQGAEGDQQAEQRCWRPDVDLARSRSIVRHFPKTFSNLSDARACREATDSKSVFARSVKLTSL
jgi:hypothetical protein